jgi:LysM repeat protein
MIAALPLLSKSHIHGARPSLFYGIDESGNFYLITDESGNISYEQISVPIYRTDYTATAAEVTDTYQYDSLNRLIRIQRGDTTLDARSYDAASRLIRSGPTEGLAPGWVAAANQGLQPGLQQAAEIRINRWASPNRLYRQFVKKSDGSAKYNVFYDAYDAASNVLNYRIQNFDGTAYTAHYSHTHARFEGYLHTATNGGGDRFYGGSSQSQYDANGHLTGITDQTLSANNRSFVNDAEGRALYVNQAGNVMRQLIANGEVIARYGSGVDESRPRDAAGNPRFTNNIADFNFGYQPINGSYPAASPGLYTVRPGDTLDGIARSAFGDGRLWYSIAEANGIQRTTELKVGQTLTIPSRVAAMSNSASSFTPYNPGKVIGDTTPNLPQPQASGGGGGGCGGIGRIFVVVVAVAATIFTVGALSTASATLGQIMSAGANALSGGLVGTAAAGAGSTAAALGVVGTAAVGAAVGSIAGQVAGLATGIQETFSWKQVGLSAISGGITAGVGDALKGKEFFKTLTVQSAATRAAIATTLSQGIGVATGLQDSFSWRNVTAAAVGAGVGASETLKAALGAAIPGNDLTERIVRGTVAGIASGTTAALMRGGRVVVGQIASDAFGNAIGNAIAASADPSSDKVSRESSEQSDQAERLLDITPLAINAYRTELARSAGLSGQTENSAYADALVQAKQLAAERAAYSQDSFIPNPTVIGENREGGQVWSSATETYPLAFNGPQETDLMRSLLASGSGRLSEAPAPTWSGDIGNIISNPYRGPIDKFRDIVRTTGAYALNNAAEFDRKFNSALGSNHVQVALGFGTVTKGANGLRALALRQANTELKAVELSFDKVTRTWTSPAGLDYGPGSVHGNRVKHVLDHLVPNPSKPSHTMFNVERNQVLGLIDEAWAIRVAPLPSDPGAFVVPMGRVIGTSGETSIKIIVRPGTSKIVTAYPMK